MNKTYIILISTLIGFPFCSKESKQFNSDQYSQSEVVLRGELLTKPNECDKYCWFKIKVIDILKKPKDINIRQELKIAVLSIDNIIPEGKSTYYLERYNKSNTDEWRLLNGKASSGISHNNQK